MFTPAQKIFEFTCGKIPCDWVSVCIHVHVCVLITICLCTQCTHKQDINKMANPWPFGAQLGVNAHSLPQKGVGLGSVSSRCLGMSPCSCPESLSGENAGLSLNNGLIPSLGWDRKGGVYISK